MEILLAIFVISNVSFVATVARLQVRHKEIFNSLGIDGRLFCGSVKQLATIIEFIIKRKPIELQDSFLICSSYTFLVSFIGGFALMFRYVIAK